MEQLLLILYPRGVQVTFSANLRVDVASRGVGGMGGAVTAHLTRDVPMAGTFDATVSNQQDPAVRIQGSFQCT